MRTIQNTRVQHTSFTTEGSPIYREGRIVSAGGGSYDNGIHVIVVRFETGEMEWVNVSDLTELAS